MHENARMPADRGLSGLGLVMQLGGGMFATLTAMIGFMQLMVMSELRAAVDTSGVFWLFVMMLVGVARSAMHRAAGTEILYGVRPSAAIRRYLGFAAGHTALWCIYLHSEDVPASITLSIALLFAAWPVTLAILFAQPRLRDLESPLRIPEDKGFEGAGILMIVLGLCGAIYAGLTVLVMLDAADGRMPFELKLLVAALAMLIVRSAIHVHAGWQALTFRDLDRTMAAAIRYATFAVFAALTLGGVLLILMMKENGGLPGMIMIAGVASLLLVWPIAIRRFVQDRRFAGHDPADMFSPAQRSVDHGMTALGWLLVALGAVSLASALPGVLLGSEREMARHAIDELLGVAPLTGEGSPWWSVAIAALQLWAGVELISMTERHRLAATVYGVLATAMTIYISLPVLENLDKLGDAIGRHGDILGVAAFGGLALSLVVPVATLLLAQRGGPPTAQARYVDRSG